jgi:hypothetical protein
LACFQKERQDSLDVSRRSKDHFAGYLPEYALGTLISFIRYLKHGKNLRSSGRIRLLTKSK